MKTGIRPSYEDSRGEPPDALAIPPARLNAVLEKLAGGGCGFAVIDTGGDSNNAGYTAAQAADLILVPCRVGRFDIRALSRTLDLARLVQKPAQLVFNDLAPNASKIRAEAQSALAPRGCAVTSGFRAASI